MEKNSDWKEGLERERAQKDKSFAVHGQSPIPPGERAKFKGLEYYPPDVDYRFELELHEHDDKKLLQIDVCPFVPQENWLKMAIRAGEESYHLKKANR